MPVTLTDAQIADRLTREGGAWTQPVVTFSFNDLSQNGVALDAGHMEATRRMLANISEMIDIDFQEVASGGDLTLNANLGGGTYANWQIDGFASIQSAQVYLDLDPGLWSQNLSGGYQSGGLGEYTLLHEIAHTLGLDHPGDYDFFVDGVEPTYQQDAGYVRDTQRYTVMSYFRGFEDGSNALHIDPVGGRALYPQTLMVHDLLALTQGSFAGRSLTYDLAPDTRLGDTTYGWNATAGINPLYDFTQNTGPLLTIVDSGGIDTLDLSGDTETRAIFVTYDANGVATRADYVTRTSAVIDLREGGYSSSHGLSHNIGIAFGTVIENAVGTSFDDRIHGNQADNVLRGMAGNDLFSGGLGDDRVEGGSGTDTVSFGIASAQAVIGVASDGLVVIGEGIDWIANDVEWLEFTDGRLSFAALAFSAAPALEATDNAIALSEDAGPAQLDLVADDLSLLGGLTLTALGGIPAGPGEAVALSGGVTVTVLDGTTVEVSLAPSLDGLKLGEVVSFDLAYTVTDSFGLSDTGQLTVTVEGSNDPVDARDDQFDLGGDPLADAAHCNVLDNDVDADQDPLAVTGVAGGTVGTAFDVQSSTGREVEVLLRPDGTLEIETVAAVAGETLSLTYTASDGAGSSDTADVVVELGGALPDVVGEAGTVTVSQPGPATWYRVSFTEQLDDAVVVLGPVSRNGSHATVTRVRDVTETGFEFQLDEWDYLDGVHRRAETVSWVAVEAGTHALPDGRILVAQTARVGGSATTVDFSQELTDPVVVGQIVSTNDPEAAAVRLREVTSTGVTLRTQGQETSKAHGREDVALIAVEAGAGTIEAATYRDGITHRGDQFDFLSPRSEAPVLLADMQTFNGSDPGAIRLRDIDAAGADLFIEEERSRDDELRHKAEDLGLVVFDDGLIVL